MLDADILANGKSWSVSSSAQGNPCSWQFANPQFRVFAKLPQAPSASQSATGSCAVCIAPVGERVELEGVRGVPASLGDVVMRNSPGILYLVLLAIAGSSEARYIFGNRRLFEEGTLLILIALSSCSIVRV